MLFWILLPSRKVERLKKKTQFWNSKRNIFCPTSLLPQLHQYLHCLSLFCISAWSFRSSMVFGSSFDEVDFWRESYSPCTWFSPSTSIYTLITWALRLRAPGTWMLHFPPANSPPPLSLLLPSEHVYCPGYLHSYRCSASWFRLYPTSKHYSKQEGTDASSDDVKAPFFVSSHPHTSFVLFFFPWKFLTH